MALAHTPAKPEPGPTPAPDAVLNKWVLSHAAGPAN